MARPSTFSVEIEGLGRLVAKLRHEDPIYAAPWREALQRATLTTEAEAKRVAPTASGRLRASIGHRLDARPVPRWGMVSTDATAADGTRYPFVLQAGRRSPKRGRIQVTTKRGRVTTRLAGRRAWRRITAEAGNWISLHYRSGSRRGQSTRAWLNLALRATQQKINGLLQEAARKIEREWER